MAFVDEFSDLLQDTATFALWTGQGTYGSPTYGSESSSVAARVVRRPKLVRTEQGDEAVSSHHVWLATTTTLTARDRVTLSDGSTPEILSVEQPQDETGSTAVTKVFFR